MQEAFRWPACHLFASAYPDCSLIITGHSICAAIATLAGAEPRSMNYTADIYTYGSPRIGNTAFATFVTSQAPELGGNTG